ncbi:uncharacterized protein LOC111695986 isoform X2 [Eurytemora carolleeae]|uniref:uncharacterized protein LOC111695986 isoform X2 n=1 Tax=Eurytemora carolleeae TaxID=1294199 RepID=UPI000C788827|nr:uncharacterized protein LOC111695986 isoform X2 [Eurytemora carolleeae]|eukprot:XP_023321255.1 uncharacterized protein LOC111695986 isoform X2 [Eurytemora affinis]
MMSPSVQSDRNRSNSFHNISSLGCKDGKESMKDEERRKENEPELIWKERMRTSSCRKDMYSSSTLPLPNKHKNRISRHSVSPDRPLISPDVKRSRVHRYSPDQDIYSPPPGLLQRAHSQVTMHYTTVPQSLVSRQLGSRHYPTRSSLRRSRLLVLVKDGTVPRKYLPGVVERERIGILLTLVQLCSGCIATALAVWRIVSLSNLSRYEDWPYYSGLMVLLSGWFGLILLLNCRYLYPGVSHHPCIFPIKPYHIIGCVVLSSLGAVSSLVSSICYTLHIITYTYSSCQDAKGPPDWPVETLESCVCLSSTPLWRNGELLYPASTCLQIESIMPSFLSSLLTLNIISLSSCLGFLILLSSSSQVQTFKNWRKQNQTKPSRKQGALVPML